MGLQCNRAVLPVRLGEETVCLRLTVAGQLKLEKKYKTDSLSLIFDATNNIEKAIDVFGEALNWSGNENTVTDGAEFYDLLVDNGYKGMDGFGTLICQIAATSGLLTEEQAEKASTGVRNTINAVFDQMEHMDAEEAGDRFPKEETPV